MTELDSFDKVVDTVMESGAIIFDSQLFTPEERAALEDCISREINKFTVDPRIMPERIKHLHTVLAKLSELSN